MPPSGPPQSSGTWLAEEWARQSTRVMESMTGEAPYVNFAPHQLSAAETQPGDDFLWWEQTLSLGADKIVWVGAETRSWEEIGKWTLQSAGGEEHDRETIRSTYLEIVQQTLAGISGALSARAGKEVTGLEGRQSPPAALNEAGIVSYRFEITSGKDALPLLACFSQALIDHFNEPVPVEEAPPKPARTSALQLSAGPPTSNSFDLLLDVELPVSISFGRAQLSLKDVLKLTTGSIVELNRAVSEPVDVIVNNCVIARGEVVVVEGNFGVRIKQVISRQERLRTLN